MASRHSLTLAEDLTCPVCSDIFTHPVILSCSHSFCALCIQRCWENRQFRDCPVCRQRSLSADLVSNRALKDLSENFKKRSLAAQEPQEAREEVQANLRTLEEKLKMFYKATQNCHETAAHIKTQADNMEGNIKEEFKMLQQFLQEEENVRIAYMREEEKRKRQNMKEEIVWINREIASLSHTIQLLKEELKAEDTSFMQNLQATKERAWLTLPDPQLGSGALMNVANHLGNLRFRVWEKMKELVKFTPVLLDPNTVHPILSLSADLTSVGRSDTPQRLPDNPERFTMGNTAVLGSEGFSSGQHSWEVEVGDDQHWVIGVARVGMTDYGGCGCIGSDEFTCERPQRIRVQLNCDVGEVSFYNTKDMTLIHTYIHGFTTVYPFFCLGPAGDLKILPSE